jgi:transglutaminase-like putative cysteine protease
MKNLIYYIIISCLISNISFSQRSLEPSEDEIALAKKTREKYLKDDVVNLSSHEEITFEINKKEGKVIVNNVLKERIMNINNRAMVTKYEFYNGESSIEKIKVRNRGDREIYTQVYDEFYKDKDLFYNDAKIKYLNLTFPIQGYSYTYESEKKYNDIKYFTSIYFNDEYPNIEKEIVITVPDWLNLELREFNFEGNKISKTILKNPKENTTIYTYKMEDVLAISKEEDIPGRSYIYPHLLLIAKSFQSKDKTVNLFSSTADLYKWYKSLVDLMKDDTAILKEKVAELTANAKTDEEKIKNIYYWVQDNIRYIAFEDGIAGFKPDDSNNVFSKRYGDCKGMGNLTKQMLKLAGFDARLTWLGTKHIAYDYTVPSICVDNHMICTLLYKGKKYFLDGTEKYNSFGEYAERIQNKEVLIEDGDKFIVDKVPTTTPENNKEIYKANFVIENEKLKGVCNRSATGEARASFLQIFNSFETNKKGETLEKYLSSQDKNIEVDNVKTSDIKNRDLKLNIDYNISINNKVSSFDNEIYIDFENRNEYKNFELKDRKNNYEFDFKKNYQSDITLLIPNGYKVSKLPEDIEIVEDNFSASVKYTQTPKEILYKKSFIFKNGEIKSNQITKWNDFIKKLNKVYNQQITLSKQ